MEDTLTQVGLSRVQAATYLYLLDHDQSSPPALSAALKVTRSNAYKVLDRLVELGLARRDNAGEKLIYTAEDPALLSELVGAARNHAIAVEHAAKAAMEVLHERYAKKASPIVLQAKRGKQAVAALYEQQATLKKPIYYVKSPLDVTYMGYETLNRLRYLPAELGSQRFGITPDGVSGSADPAVDKRTNLHRTWVAADEYRSPVEWSVSGDELNIYVFDKDTYALNIKNAVVAHAFQELWALLDKSLRLRPDYQTLPKRAQRTI